MTELALNCGRWMLLRLVSERFRHPLLGILLVITGVVIVTNYVVMVEAQKRLIEHEAVKIAEVVARHALASRTVYTNEIANKLTPESFGPHPAAGERAGFVPLPAQFLKLVGRESSASSGGLYRYKPLSKWNLEPSQGLGDDFQRWAWTQLEAQDRIQPAGPIDWRPAWRFENVQGVRTLRYIRADAASTPSCVGCHNQYEAMPGMIRVRSAAGVPPGKQWTQHQLLGAIEVQVPVDKVDALATDQSRMTLALVLAVSILGLSAAAWFAVRDVRSKQALALRFERQAKFDSLTGLPNRAFFRERAEAILPHAARENTMAAVMFVDLDNFKNINDSLGHAAGDEVLQEIARRFSAILRDTDTVARQGGDEFSILATGVRDTGHLATLARKLIDELTQPLRIGGQELFVSASIGIACYPQDGKDAAALLKNADAAMYRAKENGRNNFQFFSAALNVRARAKLALSTQLRQALDRGQLELHYQPKVALASGRITGVEALVRWRHPENGLILPERFIPIAEETGLIEPLGEWVLLNALTQAKAWIAMGLDIGRVGVNLSVRQFRHPDLATHIFRTLDRVGVSAHRLELEITESMVMQDPQKAEATLAKLHNRGIAIAIDDFGIGYSSLSYLKRFSINALKIDKSFVDGIPHDENDCAITRAVVALAASLKIRSIAEGVETQEQRDFLLREGCNEMQGFLLSRPVPAAELERFLAAYASA